MDTASLQPWSSIRLGGYSRYNLMHAVLVRNIAVQLQQQGYCAGAKQSGEALGIVSPYGAQTQLIQALLQDKIGDAALKLAATVHSFQGNEKDTMLVDLPDALGTRLGQFMKAKEREEVGARLLNVAISRAREHVVLIANFEYLLDQSPHDGITRRLLTHFQQHAERLDADALLALDDGWQFAGSERLNVGSLDFAEGTTEIYTSGTFYPAFSRDLGAIKRSLVIFSPFLTERGCSRWVEHFRSAIARGVAVRVVSRPPGDQGGVLDEGAADIIAALRKVGVVVDLRARMHEKIAVIDSEILWHGSLNILSHRDTSESMLRIPGAAACEQMARSVSTPLGNKDPMATWGARENPACPQCDGPTVWKNGQFGIYFECEAECGGRTDARAVRRATTSAKVKEAGGRVGERCPNPDCTGTLKARKGPRGPFLGCSNYPTCRHTKNY